MLFYRGLGGGWGGRGGRAIRKHRNMFAADDIVIDGKEREIKGEAREHEEERRGEGGKKGGSR